MGAGAGAAAAIESESSPRRAAIEKAPAELRRELALREERRRELEFLEKGGELLDFYSAPYSAVPSSSLSDPVAGQLMSSEAEGGYALIAQANGGSLENSLGTSFFGGRDSEGGDHHASDDVASTASESQTLAWEVTYRAPRTGSGSVRLHSDANLKREIESSGIGRVGTQSQAYSRRNRQRSNRFGNGYTPAREVERIVEGNASPSVEGKGPSAPPIVSVEVCKGNESMVEKNAQQLLVHGLPSTSGNRVGLGTSKANDNLEGSNLHIVKRPDLQPAKNVSPLDACASRAKLPSNCGLIVTDCVAAGRCSDVEDGICTDISVKEDLPAGTDSNKSDHLLLTPCLEESLGARAGGALSQPLRQSLCNSQTALDKEVSLPIVVKNETSVMMVREKSSVSGPHGARSEWKNKLSASQPQRAMDRGTGVPSNLLPEFTTIVPNMDDKRFVKLGVADPVQVTSRSLDSSEHRSNATRKTTSTASSGALEISKGELVPANEKLLGSARVEVKIEEGFSEVGTGQSAADTEVESGHDVKSIYKISLPKEEVKSEDQTTPVSQGSNRTGFRTPSSLAASNKFPGVVLPWEKEKDPSVIAEAERHKADLSAKARRAHEDYIIEEAEIIKTGKRDSAEWGRRRPEQEPVRRKSHWDFVLEEMAWMANDFMQERLWKAAAASQICRWISQLKGQSEFRGKDVIRRQKKVAHVLANAVNEFWRSIELTMHKDRVAPVNSQEQEESTRVKDDSSAGPMDANIPAATETSGKPLLQQQLSKKLFPIQAYAKSFLLESLGVDVAPQAEGPSTPARVSEASGVLDLLWEDQFAEEALCYTVPSGAFASYRYAVETQRALLEAEYEQKLQEQAAALAEAEAQAAAEAIATADFIAASADDGQSLGHLSSPTQGVRTDEDGTQYGLLHSSVSKKKRKNILKSNSVKMEGLPHAVLSRPMTFHNFDSGGGLPSPLVTGKRSLPAGTTPTSANVGVIPTKRMRSGTTRQRLGTASPSPFPSPAGLMNRTTFSSGALNSNHEEVHNMAECPISARAENDAAGAAVGKNILGGGDGSPFLNSKSKKKKKTKHFSGALGSIFKTDGSASGNTGSTPNPVESEHHSVYDQLQQKRKGDLQHGGSLEASAGGIGSSAETSETPLLQGQQPLKKAKLSKQASDINSEGATAVVTLSATQSGSMVANTSGTSKLLRQNSNRDRNRKGRTNKVSVGQPAGIGIPWSTIEDQAILALVHDLGPNWELVSDVLSSSSQLKGIFRRPKQCKERHKALMDRLSVGEGGESPEDPSTSQPHPSTLPGIPKGSARVLLQRLQGPAEEDTLKVHLEHIVRVFTKFRSLKPQIDEQKVLAAPHPSHMNAVSQICNSGAAGGFPTPLELCDLSAANAELGSPSYPMPGQPMPGILPPGSGIRPATNGMPVLPGASNAHMGVPAMAPSNVAVNAARDVHRLVGMRPFSPEEAQRVRYARAMAAARGLPVPGPSVTAGLPIMPISTPNDGSVPMLPVGNNVGLMGGLSRGMSLSRAGMPGMGSPGVSGMGSPTLGTMLPPGGVGMVGAGPSVGSVGVPNQFNLVRRPRDQMVRPPTRTSDEQRQIQFQELQHQAAQGNPEAQTTLTGMSRDLLNPLIPAAPQSFSSQQLQNQHQNHLMRQQYKERHQQFQNQQQQHKQRMFQQQLQQPTSLPLPLQLHSMPSQQHVLPQQSLVAQHQHLLPQQHSLQKQQTQQGPQQPVLPLPSSPMHPMASPPLPPNHQQHQTLSQSQSQQPLQPSGQVPQLSVQSKLQQPKQLQKHQHLHQSSQALQQQQPQQQPQQQQHQQHQQQQQQQQPRVSKGVARGTMVLQPGQSNILPGNVALGNQLSQQISGQAISHSVPGPRSLQLQVPISMGKQPSQGTPEMMTGQGGQMQAQQNLASPGSSVPVSAGQQQKVLQQQPQVPLATKQQQVSPPVHPLHTQQSSPTPGQSNQQQLSPPPQQSQIIPPQQGQPRQQSQQQPHLQQFGQQRRLQQRQPGSSVGGVPGASQLAKTGSSQQGHISSQVPTQPGHGTYPLGTNMAGSSPMGTSTTNPLIPPVISSGTAGVHSTQWKPGQNVSSMSTGMYNLTRSGSLGVAPMSSGTSTPRMHIASRNGCGTLVSSSNPHGMSTAVPQVGSGLQGQKAGVLPGAISRAGSGTSQGGAQRSSQQHHGNVGLSIPVGAAGHIRPPSPGGIMPVSMVGPSTAAGVPHSGSMTFPGTSVALPGHSAALPNSIPMFGVQPRQSHAGSAAMNSSAVLQKSSAPTTVNATSSSASAGSSDLVKSPGTVYNSTGADQNTSS